MAVPKHKTSKSRRDKRRTHKKAAAVNLAKCSNCGEIKEPHRVCPNCGTYRGREVVEGEE